MLGRRESVRKEKYKSSLLLFDWVKNERKRKDMLAKSHSMVTQKWNIKKIKT